MTVHLLRCTYRCHLVSDIRTISTTCAIAGTCTLPQLLRQYTSATAHRRGWTQTSSWPHDLLPNTIQLILGNPSNTAFHNVETRTSVYCLPFINVRSSLLTLGRNLSNPPRAAPTRCGTIAPLTERTRDGSSNGTYGTGPR